MPDPIYPTADAWTTATPAELGMDAAKLAEAQAYAESLTLPTPTLGAGMIVRRGYKVHEWGNPLHRYHVFSVTKGIGAVLLGVANNRLGVTLQDRAQVIYPEFGANPGANVGTGFLDDVTLEQLATHSAGFEDVASAPRFEYQPGTKWLYTDGGANWLADVLTVKFGEDLRETLTREILNPLGITRADSGAGDLTWRTVANANGGAGITVARRDFNAGINTNVDSMARIGLLLERDGNWEGTQILLPEYVEKLRTPSAAIAGLPIIDSNSNPDPDFPNVTAHHGLFWFNNADGAIENVPPDTYWTWGAGDHLIVVIPSLDLVIARTSGEAVSGSAKRAWPRPTPCVAGDWCGRYEVLAPFLTPIVQAVQSAPPPPPGAPTVSLASSVPSVTVGGTATLTWSSTLADSCAASNGWTGTKAATGTETVTVSQTATYTLACTGAGGTTESSVTVTANPAPGPSPPSPPPSDGGGGGGGALQWWMLAGMLLAGAARGRNRRGSLTARPDRR